jgi:hypothetical protein
MKRIFHKPFDDLTLALRFSQEVVLMIATGLLSDREYSPHPRNLVTIKVGKVVL